MEQPNTDSEAASRWREHIKVHPAADLFPVLPDAELLKLGDDIKANGLRNKVIVKPEDDGSLTLLDGRGRLDAMELAGIPVIPDGKLRSDLYEEAPRSVAPEALVISLNIRRRHLNAEQKHQLIEELLKANPAQSDRAIAKAAHVDNKTVGAVRRDLEATEEIPQLDKRVGTDGKTRAASPPPRQAEEQPEHPEERDVENQAEREDPENQDDESQVADPTPNESEVPPHPEGSPLLAKFVADAKARAGDGKKTRAATSRATSAKPKAAAPPKEPAPPPPTGLGTPREQWIAVTATAYKAPAPGLYDAPMDTARLMNDALHMDEIPETKRVALLRKFAAALTVPYLLRDPADDELADDAVEIARQQEPLQ